LLSNMIINYLIIVNLENKEIYHTLINEILRNIDEIKMRIFVFRIFTVKIYFSL
jgi:hypothetical protein